MWCQPMPVCCSMWLGDIVPGTCWVQLHCGQTSQISHCKRCQGVLHLCWPFVARLKGCWYNVAVVSVESCDHRGSYGLLFLIFHTGCINRDHLVVSIDKGSTLLVGGHCRFWYTCMHVECSGELWIETSIQSCRLRCSNRDNNNNNNINNVNRVVMW